MAFVNIVSDKKYKSAPPKVGDKSPMILKRRITGAQLLAYGTGADPSVNCFAIAQLRKGQLVREVKTIVVVADGAVITLDIGYYQGTTSVPTAFETDAALDSKGVTISADDSLVMFNDSFLTITPSAAVDSTTILIIEATIEDYGNELRDDVMTAVL